MDHDEPKPGRDACPDRSAERTYPVIGWILALTTASLVWAAVLTFAWNIFSGK